MKTGKQQLWIVADTEDNSRELLAAGKSGFDKQVTQIAAIASDGSTFHNRGNVIEFLRWLKSKTPCKVYFHNLRYDLGNLFGKALDVPDLLMVGGRVIWARWQRVVFHDSLNIWPMSVARLGKVVGLDKLAFDPNNREYVFRDCEIVARAIRRALDLASEFGIERLPATIGSLAVKIWKATGGETWFDDYQGSKLAYFGGRVELFRPSAIGQVSYCDINSLYPWCMTQRFPAALEPQGNLDCEGIALVSITVPTDSYIAPLPVRRDDDSIYYPVGKLKGVWTTHEIRTAVRYGATIDKVYEIQGSKETGSYYRDFIVEFYNRRLHAETEGEKTFYKLLLNAFYGQSGMSGRVSRSLIPREHTLDGIPYGNKLLVETTMPLPNNTNYLHAAYITSYARTRLLDALHQTPWKDLIYCDTDSVISEGPPPFPISSDLGQFKLEKTWTYCKTHAPKIYEADDTCKAKGVPARLARKFIDTGSVEYDQPFGMREAIIGYDDGNAKQLSVWRKVEKKMRTQYDKKKLVDGHYYPLIQS